MEFSFKAEVVLTLDHQPGAEHSTHVATDFNLFVEDNLEKSTYLDENDIPNAEGVKALSNTLVQGLVGNIQFAHQRGLRDSAEHLRWIIAELERGFATVANITESTFRE